jgi:hypothetical protein
MTETDVTLNIVKEMLIVFAYERTEQEIAQEAALASDSDFALEKASFHETEIRRLNGNISILEHIISETEKRTKLTRLSVEDLEKRRRENRVFLAYVSADKDKIEAAEAHLKELDE